MGLWLQTCSLLYCIQVQADNLPFIEVADSGRRANKRNAAVEEFAPLRVYVVFDSSIAQNPILNAAFRDANGPFRNALRVLSNGLQVRPVQGNITIPYTCTNITSGPNAGKCLNSTVQIGCGIFSVPEELRGHRPEACTSSYGSCTGPTPAGAGVDADYILFAGSLSSKLS